MDDGGTCVVTSANVGLPTFGAEFEVSACAPEQPAVPDPYGALSLLAPEEMERVNSALARRPRHPS